MICWLAVEQRVEGVEELLLGAVLPGEELDVVDKQRVDALELALELVGGALLQRGRMRCRTRWSACRAPLAPGCAPASGCRRRTSGGSCPARCRRTATRGCGRGRPGMGPPAGPAARPSWLLRPSTKLSKVWWPSGCRGMALAAPGSGGRRRPFAAGSARRTAPTSTGQLRRSGGRVRGCAAGSGCAPRRARSRWGVQHQGVTALVRLQWPGARLPRGIRPRGGAGTAARDPGWRACSRRQGRRRQAPGQDAVDKFGRAAAYHRGPSRAIHQRPRWFGPAGDTLRRPALAARLSEVFSAKTRRRPAMATNAATNPATSSASATTGFRARMKTADGRRSWLAAAPGAVAA